MRLSALSLLAMLAACSSREAPQPEPSASVTPAAISTEPRTMVAADFVPEDLGGRIAGMEVSDAPVGDAGAPVARLDAFVACPKEIALCDPAKLPAETRYTYVVTVTPVPEASAKAAASTSPAPIPVPAGATLATIAPVPGFEGGVGYSLAQAAAALGAEDAISVTLDQGRIVWRAADGSRWVGGKPITVWWQSTRPPADKVPAYELASGTDSARISAPFPAEDKAVEGTARR